MIQMYTPEVNRDPYEEKAFEVFKGMIEPLRISLKEMYENAYIGLEVGKALYNTNASPIRKVWDNPRTQVVYPFWHNLYKDLQTCDDLMLFINALYRSAEPYFNITAPLAIGITVDVNWDDPLWWNRDGRYNLETIPGDLEKFDDDKEAQLFVTDSSTDAEDMVGIVFGFVAIKINDDAFAKILRDVIYPGLYYNVSIIK